MPTADVNGTRLYYEITGEGFPLMFSHEFAGDYRSWEPQVRFFSRRYRVITYNHRGYPPSDVPTTPEAYSEAILVEDLYQLLQVLKVPKAHLAGLSMGAGVVLNFGLKHPEMCASLIIASCGSGSTNREQFLRQSTTMVEQLEKEGMKAFAEDLNQGPPRRRFQQKDPRGWQESKEQMFEHSALGSALVFRGVPLKRPTIFDHEAGLKQLRVPTLLMMGDEDESCFEPTIFMKRQMPRAGLMVFPRSGHVLNLEEPDLFNRAVLDFVTAVEAGSPGMS
jgi:pimeloyl-ACP methyl ester carboxylesterase